MSAYEVLTWIGVGFTGMMGLAVVVYAWADLISVLKGKK